MTHVLESGMWSASCVIGISSEQLHAAITAVKLAVAIYVLAYIANGFTVHNMECDSVRVLYSEFPNSHIVRSFVKSAV